MRSLVRATTFVLAILTATAAHAQPDTAASPAPAAPVAGLPSKPVPYTTLRPKPAPRVRTTTAARAQTTTGASAPVGATSTLPALPTAASGARLGAGEALPTAELEAYVDGVVRDAMAREHIAGTIVTVVQNGQVVLKKGYGFASLTPKRRADPDRSLFKLGSIAKVFTWIAVMQEVEAGRMRLNQPVNLYLPEKVQVRDQGYDTPVRVMNLMDHSAGFEERILGQLFERDFSRVRPLDLYLRQERPRRVHAPGAISSYANYDAGLGGMAAAYSAGKPYERLIEEQILLPLGMRHTTFREPHPEKPGIPGAIPAALIPDIATGYRWTPSGFDARPFEYTSQIAPAEGAMSSGADMARLMLTMLGDGQLEDRRIYSPRTAQLFRTPLRHTQPGVNGWAHGLQVYDLPGGYVGYGHAGTTMSFKANMVTVPSLNLGVFIAVNTETGRSLIDRFPERLVRQFYAAPVTFPRPGSQALLDDRAAFEGYYVSTRRTYGGLEGFGGLLVSGSTVTVTPRGQLIVNNREGAKTFVPDGDIASGRFIGVDSDERLIFNMSDGVADSLRPASGVALWQRAPFWMRPRTLVALAGLTGLAALATLGGLIARNRREFRQNTIQARASLVQNIQAALWLVGLAMFAAYFARTGDIAQVMYGWPGPLLVTASACALVGAVLTLLTVAALPAVWRGGRRVDSWTAGRKAGFTLTTLIYLAFSTLMGLWGALSPWGG